MNLAVALLSVIVLFLLGAPSETFVLKHVSGKETDVIKKYCGLPTDKKPSFKVDGPDGKISQFPWSVLLHIKINVLEWDHPPPQHHIQKPSPTNALTVGICSGILISTRHILTAAHCLFDEITWKDPETKKPKSLYTQITPQKNKITAYIGGQAKEYKVIDGGYYSEATNAKQLNEYDFAILQLEKSLSIKKIKQGTYRPICFNSKKQHDPFLDKETVVAGYGGEPTKLRYQVTSETTCPPFYKHSPVITCYRGVTEEGDSGAAYFKYGKGNRGHLTAIVIGDSKEVEDTHLGVDCETGNEKGPLHRVQTKLLLSYSTKS